jgi:hypothetical protein
MKACGRSSHSIYRHGPMQSQTSNVGNWRHAAFRLIRIAPEPFETGTVFHIALSREIGFGGGTYGTAGYTSSGIGGRFGIFTQNSNIARR